MAFLSVLQIFQHLPFTDEEIVVGEKSDLFQLAVTHCFTHSMRGRWEENTSHHYVTECRVITLT